MKVNNFEDLNVWSSSQQLARELYKTFKSNRDYGFRDQILRAGVSVSNNIAEGFERKGNKEFKRFIYIAKGSCGEVRSMLYLAKDLNFLNEEDFTSLHDLTVVISRQLGALIKSLPHD